MVRLLIYFSYVSWFLCFVLTSPVLIIMCFSPFSSVFIIIFWSHPRTCQYEHYIQNVGLNKNDAEAKGREISFSVFTNGL